MSALDRECLRSVIRKLQAEDQAIDAEYPDIKSMPQEVVRRSRYIAKQLVEYHIMLQECMWCGCRTARGYAYCTDCIAKQKEKAEQILADLRAEEARENDPFP